MTTEDVKTFIGNEDNKKTAKKTLLDVRKFERFLAQKGEIREIQNLEPDHLDEYLANFALSIKKTDNTEYEPSTLRNIISSIDRKLKRHKYPFKIISEGPQFQLTRDALKAKQKSLKKAGKGNKPKEAQPITDEEIEILYEKEILGNASPTALLNSMWFNNTVHFGLRGTMENYNLRWGDIQLKASSDGTEYLELTERQTKTRTGANVTDVRKVAPRIYATHQKSPSRDPIELYKLYSQKRPANYSNDDHPFYIAARTIPVSNASDQWFTRSIVGQKKIASMLKTMALKGGLDKNKRITNHSARKHLVQKLRDSGVAPTDIMQVSGHKNIQSIMTYSAMSENRQKECSHLLSSTKNAAASATVQKITTVETSKENVPSNYTDVDVGAMSESQHNYHSNSATVNRDMSMTSVTTENTTLPTPNMPLQTPITLQSLTISSNTNQKYVQSIFAGATLNINNFHLYKQ